MSGPATTDDGPLAARRTLATLEQQHRDAQARQATLAAERERLAYAANTGDAAARKALDGLNTRALTAGLEIENLASAITEARRRVVAADEAARIAALRQKARQARAKLAELRTVGAEANDALAQFGAKFAAFLAVADDLRHLDLGGPGRDLVLANARRTVQAELTRFHLQTEIVPPSERRTLAELVARWAELVESRIADVLGTADREEAA